MDNTLSKRIKEVIKEVPDFPQPGISFKDFSPLLQDATLSEELLHAMERQARALKPNYIAGLESRGFMFGFALAQRLGIGFIPVRKPGKLPRKVFSQSYDLEYGKAALELHSEDVEPGSRVLIHDDLLATGGTARAAYDLFEKAGAQVVGFHFIMELEFLNGKSRLPDLPKHSEVVY